MLRFFRDESCGKCVPCRVGSTKAHTILSELIESGGGPEDVDERIRQVALGPVISMLGLKRGGTEARPQPRPARPPDQTTGQTEGAPDSPDDAIGS